MSVLGGMRSEFVLEVILVVWMYLVLKSCAAVMWYWWLVALLLGVCSFYKFWCAVVSSDEEEG